MGKRNKKLYIDMCAGSELKDTQGETLSVEGADISELEAGRGRLNDNHGKGFFNSLGRITKAKKIFKAEDCENERHEYYWNKIKAPYIYVAGELYNDEDHGNAKAAAAILRNIHREDCPLKMKASVEGGVISRGISDPTRLARTKIHSVALTMTPANNATLVEPLNLDKSSSNWETDKQLIKSVIHLAETNIPSFRHIERHASANTIHDNIMKIQELAKSLGINIEVKTSDPTEIIQQALVHKITNNVHKINELVKAIRFNTAATMMKPTVTSTPNASPGKVRIAQEEKVANKVKANDNYQQNIGKLKSESKTPTVPVNESSQSENMRVRNARAVQRDNDFKVHASKAMRDPEHLNFMRNQLTDRGIHPDKIGKIIDRVKSHMVKTEDDDIEKGDGIKAIKNLTIAGALAVGAHSLGDNETPKSINSNKAVERSIASIKPKSTRFKGKDADYFNSIDDKQKARADKVKAKYANMKKGLIKALTAGYGGAGIPTGMTGGSVIQSESLDDGRSDKGLDYIVCDNCGHEQVYMQHQVKCRDCNKNFSLDKLKDHI